MGSINLSALVRHLSDSVKHITAAERTAWNAKANKSDIPTTGVKVGATVSTAGNVITYGGRTVVKQTADTSYIGWATDSNGWFTPFFISKTVGGTKYSMNGMECIYALNGEKCASFVYKGNTYYACWNNPSSFTNPTVETSAIHVQIAGSDYITACKAVIDVCEGLDAATLGGKSDFAVCQSASDIDGITESGLYRITSSAGLLLHITWDSNYMLQIRNVNSGRLSWRTKAGTWGAWSDVADGGNADTVDGKSVSDLALAEDSYWLYTYAANGNKHGAAHRIKATHNVKGDYRFHLQCESGEEVRVDFATDADTLDGYHAADLRSAPTAGSGTVGGSTAATVTLGYKPSILLITSRQGSLTSDRSSALLLHSGSQSGSFTANAPAAGNSVTVTATLTATGFTVSPPGQNYGYPFDYIAYK